MNGKQLSIRPFLLKFSQDDDGSASIEILLVVPIMVWVLLSTIVYFDAYHHQAISNRASLTIADMISREEDTDLNEIYIKNSQNILKALTETESDPDIRISLLTFDETADKYEVRWSRQHGYAQELTTEQVNLLEVRNRIPEFVNGERAILVETNTRYLQRLPIWMPPFNVQNLDGVEFDTFTIISPRFSSTVCFDNEDGTRDC